MNTIELKKELIDKISMIDEIDYLKAINIMLDYRKKEPFIELTSEQENELLIASEEARNGKFILQSEMDKKVQEWLKEEKLSGQ